jgi:hypothetical protein
MSAEQKLPDGRRAQRLQPSWAIAGLDLLLVEGERYSTGAVCDKQDGKLFTAKDGFLVAQKRLGSRDPVALAGLSMLLLEQGVAGQDPWTGPGSYGGREPPAEVNAGPPTIDGQTLRYWRSHVELANFVRVELHLESLALQTTLDSDIMRAQAQPSDELARAKQDLESNHLPTCQRAVGALAKMATAEADQLLMAAARDHRAWKVRLAAVRALASRAPTGAVEAITHILLTDSHNDVREASASALGTLGQATPEVLDALSRVAEGDGSQVVRDTATISLGKLKK